MRRLISPVNPPLQLASADGAELYSEICDPKEQSVPLLQGVHRSASLGDQILALANGKTQQEIAAACKGVRPNHIGIAIARHKRAGRIEERAGKLYATHAAGSEQHTAV